MDKHQRTLRRLARQHGLTLEQGRRHFKFRDKRGIIVAVTGTSPSDRRAHANLISTLKGVTKNG